MSHTREERSKFKTELKARIYNWTIRLTKYLRVLGKRSERVIWAIVGQLIRSGTSVGANYIEAIAAPSNNDFRKFLSYSLKSCNESKYWLATIRDAKLDNCEELHWLLREGIEISNILGKSVSTMYNNK